VPRLIGLFVDDRTGILIVVDKHANGQTGGEKGAKQQKVVGYLFPGKKKQESSDHQEFRVHGLLAYPSVLRQTCCHEISAYCN
jgi:hypothetical protein